MHIVAGTPRELEDSAGLEPVAGWCLCRGQGEEGATSAGLEQLRWIWEDHQRGRAEGSGGQ